MWSAEWMELKIIMVKSASLTKTSISWFFFYEEKKDMKVKGECGREEGGGEEKG
jgi:hypothetical protein